MKVDYADFTVLVADDSIEDQRSIRRILNKIAIEEVDIVEDGDSALAKLRQYKDAGKSFDIVISDLRMPKVSGLELLKAAKAEALINDSVFILLTAHSDKVMFNQRWLTVQMPI